MRLRVQFLIGLAFLSGLASAQSEPPRPLVRVGSQVLTTQDFEHVKTLLPFERFRTTPARSRLIDAIELNYLVTRARLEQSGMERITPEKLAATVALLERQGQKQRIEGSGYSVEAFAEAKLVAAHYLYLIFAGNWQAATIWNLALGDYMGTSLDNQNTSQVNREQTLSNSLSPGTRPIAVTLRSMLLSGSTQANAVTPHIRSEADFIKFARRISEVRREVGGSYTSDFTPSRVALSDLEPEVQLAVLQARTPGLLRLAAPFGRVWLSSLPKLPVKGSDNPSASLRFNPLSSAWST